MCSNRHSKLTNICQLSNQNKSDTNCHNVLEDKSHNIFHIFSNVSFYEDSQGSTLRSARLPRAGKKNSGQVKVPGHLPCEAGGFKKLARALTESKLQVKSKQGLSGLVKMDY